MSLLKDMIPAPLAAPETPELRAARFRVLWSCAIACILTFFFAELRSLIGPYALAPLAGAYAYCAVQIPIWYNAKTTADDAHLMRVTSDEE